MPLRQKRRSHKKLIFGLVVIALIVLMIIYFPPTQNVTEVVLHP